MSGGADPKTSYQLVVRGELDERFARLLGGVRMERDRGNTIVTCAAADEAQLHGFIDRIVELHLELLMVRRASTALPQEQVHYADDGGGPMDEVVNVTDAIDELMREIGAYLAFWSIACDERS